MAYARQAIISQIVKKTTSGFMLMKYLSVLDYIVIFAGKATRR